MCLLWGRTPSGSASAVLERVRRVLLTSGAWGTMVIEYDATYEIKGRKYPFYVKDFTPFQVTRLDVDDFIERRPASPTTNGSTFLSRASASTPRSSTDGQSG